MKPKQCGNCTWFLRILKECNYPEEKLPSCATKWRVDENDGQDCSVYAERTAEQENE